MKRCHCFFLIGIFVGTDCFCKEREHSLVFYSLCRKCGGIRELKRINGVNFSVSSRWLGECPICGQKANDHLALEYQKEESLIPV